MSANTIKIQGNVDRDLANRVNATINSLGLTPTALINMVYHTIDNTGQLPVQVKLTSEQQNALAIIQASKKIPTVQINTPEEFNKVMGEDND